MTVGPTKAAVEAAQREMMRELVEARNALADMRAAMRRMISKDTMSEGVKRAYDTGYADGWAHGASAALNPWERDHSKALEQRAVIEAASPAKAS